MGDMYWYPKPSGHNEIGWCEPGGTPAYRPDLDRDLTDIKANGILMEMHEAGLVYVSNGSMGDGVVAAVVKDCREADRYDQGFIVARLAHWCAGDGGYWRTKAAESLRCAT